MSVFCALCSTALYRGAAGLQGKKGSGPVGLCRGVVFIPL
jgi:hypothetical protein